jgi:hypothetical protein
VETAGGAPARIVRRQGEVTSWPGRSLAGRGARPAGRPPARHGLGLTSPYSASGSGATWRGGTVEGPIGLRRGGGGAGRRVWWTGANRRRRCSCPGDGARDRRTGGSPGTEAQPFDWERPCCVDPSSQPFDWGAGPSGDRARVTQSAAVRRHIPVAVWRRSNGRLCPACPSCGKPPPARSRNIQFGHLSCLSSGTSTRGGYFPARFCIVVRNAAGFPPRAVPPGGGTGTARPDLAWLRRARTGRSRAGRCRDEPVSKW